MTNDPETPFAPRATPEPVQAFGAQDSPRQDAGLPEEEPRPDSATGSRIEQLEHAVADGARSAAQNVDSYVHVYPWGAILASAAFGLVLGLLAGRG